MNKIWIKHFLILLAISVMAPLLHAQVSHGGAPYSQSHTLTSAVDSRSLPSISAQSYLTEDESAGKDEPFRFGAILDVAYNLNNSGTWETLPDGGRLCRLRIESDGAYSLNLNYDEFYLPVGATLFLYNDDYRYVIGSFTNENMLPDRRFATQPVPDDAITLEYYEPANVVGQGIISIESIVHAYRNLFGYPGPLDDFGDSGTCNNNVNCPEGANWQSDKRGAVMILTAGGSRLCSGSLINNVNNDAHPYVLTANHCGNSTTWQFMFNYESPSCANVDGPTNQTVAGGTRRFNHLNSDGSLYELSSAVPLTYNPYFNGWNANDVAATNSVCIHHPSGDIKKITFDNEAPVSSTWTGTPPNSHWRILNWDDGTTEPGSSGSPLFDENHRITGQLHGGTASCSNNIDDYFGKFSLSMTLGLRPWLDPDTTGVMTLDGFDPNGSGRITGIVRDADTDLPLPGVVVNVIGDIQSATTNASGSYLLLLSDGTYDLEFVKYAYETYIENGVIVSESDTTVLDVLLNALPTITLFSEDFENGAPDWTHSSGGGTWLDQWHISTERSHSATHSYKCGDTGTGTYASLLDARLTSPTIPNLPSDSRLSFWMQINAEISVAFPDSAYDGGVLELSQNGGAFTQVTPTPGYNRIFRTTSGGGNPYTGPMPGLPCFSDTLPWTQYELDLTAYAGNDIQLRFRFGSDAGTNREGWYVDDVVINSVGAFALTIPQELTIYTDGTDIVLHWADDANPFYKIYSSETADFSGNYFEGSTDQNSLTISGGALSAEKKFYRVVGWDGIN